MKRIISLVLLLSVALLSLLSLSACKSRGDHAVDEFVGLLEDSDNNFTVTVEISDVPILGDMRVITHYDGKKQYTPPAFMTKEQYREYRLFATYVYERGADGGWMKSRADNVGERDYLDSDEAKVLLNSDNYDKTPYAPGKYRQRAGSDMGEFRNATIYVMSDACIITAVRIIDGTECQYSARIWNIGNVTVDLPDV